MKKILFLAIAALIFTQCDTDELHNLNINPQAVNQIDLNFMFTPALLSIASNGGSGDNRYTDWRTNIGLCAYALQQMATISNISPGERYTENAETNAAPFEFAYRDQLKNIAEILKQTGKGGYDEGNKVNMRNAARILRAFTFARLVDFYGNVPYSEANKGTDGVFFPKYDDGKVIYADVLKELDEAAAAMNAGDKDQASFAKADFVYKGDVVKWKKFAYSVMLRHAMRASDGDAAMANTYVAKAVAGGVMTSNADNFVIPLADGPSQWNNQNGISRAFNPGDGGQPAFLSKTMVDFLKGKDKTTAADDDPRLFIIGGGIQSWSASSYTVTNADPLKQKGMPNGQDGTSLDALEGKKVDLNAEYTKMNWNLTQDADPYMIMNVGEVELLLAEAKLKNIGGVSGTDKSHYEAGVKAAMQMYTIYDPSLTVSDAAVTAYLTTYPYGTAKPAIEMIADQLWASKFLNWWDAWGDFRRLDLPKLTPTNHNTSITNGVIPTRLHYPSGEQASNPNLQTGGTKPDDLVTKVWWDKK